MALTAMSLSAMPGQRAGSSFCRKSLSKEGYNPKGPRTQIVGLYGPNTINH